MQTPTLQYLILRYDGQTTGLLLPPTSDANDIVTPVGLPNLVQSVVNLIAKQSMLEGIALLDLPPLN